MSDDIVARLRLYAKRMDETRSTVLGLLLADAADEIERLRRYCADAARIGSERDSEIKRLRAELAARCGDHGPGAHTAGPVETFIPEAL